MKFKIFILFIAFLIIILPADAIPITYKSFIDPGYGFYSVIDQTTHKPSPYANKILNIKIGDEIIWVNDADNGMTITISSEQGLWSDKRLEFGQNFSYTFNDAGTYNLYIKEYRSKRQKIIVGTDINSQTPIYSPIETINPTIHVTVNSTTTPIVQITTNSIINPTVQSTTNPIPEIYIKFLIMLFIAIVLGISLIWLDRKN